MTTRPTSRGDSDTAPAPPSHEVDLGSENAVPPPQPATAATATPLLDEQTGVRSVRVFDPQQQGGSNALYYAVESKRVSSNGRVRHDCVRRRFSDFVWLRAELQRSLPGCVIPPLPTKSVLGTMQSDFIVKRQRGLNLFMERIIAHSRLRHCPSLAVFLSAQSRDLEFARQERSTQEPALALAGSFGLKNFFAQKLQSVQESILGSSSGQVLSKTEADLKFERLSDTVSQTLTLATNCLTAYQGLAAASTELAQWWTNVGLALTVLSDHERKHDSADSSAVVNEAGLGADRTSVLIAHHLDREYAGFKQPLRDLIDQLRSVEEALQARANALAALQQATADVRQKQARVEQLQKRAQSADRLAEARDELARAERVRDELAAILRRVSAEIERDVGEFQSEKQAVLQRLAQTFAQIQIAHNQKMIASWQSAVAAMNSRQQ